MMNEDSEMIHRLYPYLRFMEAHEMSFNSTGAKPKNYSTPVKEFEETQKNACDAQAIQRDPDNAQVHVS